MCDRVDAKHSNIGDRFIAKTTEEVTEETPEEETVTKEESSGEETETESLLPGGVIAAGSSGISGVPEERVLQECL